MSKPLAIDLFCGLTPSQVRPTNRFRSREACDRSDIKSKTCAAWNCALSASRRCGDILGGARLQVSFSLRSLHMQSEDRNISAASAGCARHGAGDENYKSFADPAFSDETHGVVCARLRASNPLRNIVGWCSATQLQSACRTIDRPLHPLCNRIVRRVACDQIVFDRCSRNTFGQAEWRERTHGIRCKIDRT